MVNLLQPALPPSCPDSTLESTDSEPTQLTAKLLSQSLIQWELTVAPVTPISAEHLAAMQRLIKRIAQLRAVENGLTDAQLLLPFVNQEAQDVLLLESKPAAGALAQSHPLHSSMALAQTPQHLTVLAAQLLWRIAQSTHEAMRLIEGSPAQVNLDGQWQAGVLRLVVILELQSESTVALDLVTFQPSLELLESLILPENTSLQIADSLLGQQPLIASALLQQLSNQLNLVEPAFDQLWQGVTAEWLIPTRNWQTGRIRLQLKFEFTPHSSQAHPVAHTVQDLDQEMPLIRFTQPEWLEQHITTTVEHQLTQLLQQKVCLPLPKELQNVSTTDALIEIIQRGYVAIDELQYSLTLASRTFAQQALPLDELMLRILWGVSRTAYEVMQLTSGVSVRLLQPQQQWRTGTLRYVVLLTIRTPEQIWRLDLAQRADESTNTWFTEAAVVQSDQHAWCLQPISLSALEELLWQQIQQLAPEIALLQTETEVNVESSAQRQLGVIQLNAGFEFTTEAKELVSDLHPN